MSRRNKRFIYSSAFAILLASAPPSIHAGTVTHDLGTLTRAVTGTGSFTTQSEVLEEDFSVAAPTNLTAFTTSYGGGANLNGTVSKVGGFEPSLTLYAGAGAFVAQEKVNPNASAQVDPATGLALDAYLCARNCFPSGSAITTKQIGTRTNSCQRTK